MLWALAFVPIAHVEYSFEILENEMPEGFEVIYNYFGMNYVRGCRINRRGRARYSAPRYEP